MEQTPLHTLTVKATVNVPLKKAWHCWTSQEHIIHWNFASSDWHCPWAENQLMANQKFLWRMESKDGSLGFDFEGIYDEIVPFEKINYHIIDGRKVTVLFIEVNGQTLITEKFEAETENPLSLQQAGWQAILDNFKTHAETCEL